MRKKLFETTPARHWSSKRSQKLYYEDKHYSKKIKYLVARKIFRQTSKALPNPYIRFFRLLKKISSKFLFTFLPTYHQNNNNEIDVIRLRRLVFYAFLKLDTALLSEGDCSHCCSGGIPVYTLSLKPILLECSLSLFVLQRHKITKDRILVFSSVGDP